MSYRVAPPAVLQLLHLAAHRHDLLLVHAPDAAAVEDLADGLHVAVQRHTHGDLLLPRAAVVVHHGELARVGEPSDCELLRALLHLQLDRLVLQDPRPLRLLCGVGAPLPNNSVQLEIVDMLGELR